MLLSVSLTLHVVVAPPLAVPNVIVTCHLTVDSWKLLLLLRWTHVPFRLSQHVAVDADFEVDFDVDVADWR